jgi:hypothetical protein
MFYISVGLSGPVADWCDAALARLSALANAQTARFEGQGRVLESAVAALVRSNADRLAYRVDRPDAELLSSLKETQAPFLLALDDPRLLVASDHPIESIRHLANLCPMLMQLAGLPHALKVSADAIRDTPRQILDRMAGQFGITATQAELERLGAALPTIVQRPGIQDETIQGALCCYAGFFDSDLFGKIVWTHPLFTRSADPAKPLSTPVRLRDTFNGRFLVHGPYLALPPGNWSAELVLTVSPDAAGQSLVIDAYSGKVLNTLRCVLTAGEFRAPGLNFNIDSDEPVLVEIRIMAERDAAPGELVLHHALVRPGPVAGDQARAGRVMA